MEKKKNWQSQKLKRLIKLIKCNNTDQKKEDSGDTTLDPVDLKGW